MNKHSNQSGWTRQSGYIWAMLGSAVGFANILSFSAQCYKNGGGAFLIPFIMALFILGLPMLLLEGVIGQKFGLPLASAYGKVTGNSGRFFGWIAVLACVTIGAFYMMLTGYSVIYTYYMGAGVITGDAGVFFKDIFLQDSGSLTSWGKFSTPIFVSTLVVALFSWFVLIRKIQSGVERICSFFLPLLTAIVLLLAISVCFLPGATIGFINYLKPDFSRLSDVGLWRDVFGQLFFSFSLGLGIVTGYSRHTKSSMSISRAMCWVALGDFMISFIAGFAIFGCVGYMSEMKGIPFSEIVQTDSMFEMGFIIFPQIFQIFGDVVSRILGPLFFFCIFIAGVTGVFSIVESVAGNIEVEFKKTRPVAVSLALGLMAILALPFCMGNGTHILEALEPMVMGYNMLIGGIVEILFFLYLSKQIKDDRIWFKGNGIVRSWAFLSLRTVGLGVLVVIFVSSIFYEFQGGVSLSMALRWSWFTIVALAAFFLSKKKIVIADEVSKDADLLAKAS
jgi:neurotransmitter:Na+ symporter, NSS family